MANASSILTVPTVVLTANKAASLEWTDAAGNDQTFVFDLVVREEWPQLGTEITTHPVESGAEIADHVRVLLPKVTLTILATNTPIASNQWASATLSSLSIPAPQTAKGASPNLIATTLQFPAGGDFVELTIAALLHLKDQVTIFTVQGSKQTEPNMVITEFSYERNEDTGTGAILTLGLSQVRFVQTQTVTAPLPTVPRATAPVNKGQQNGSDAPKPVQESAGKKLADWILGGFA